MDPQVTLPVTSQVVRVQQADFEVGELQRTLLPGSAQAGAVATFTGYVRVANNSRKIEAMLLEHYPGMTESSIRDILQQGSARWPLLAATVVHRVGMLRPGDQIVWVGIAATHREAAFAACEFVMDYLKTRAPFWKKEFGPGGSQWVVTRTGDEERAARWQV